MIQSLSFKRDRIIWYDVAKGILILCVVLGHSEVGSSGFFNWFHMPLFFLLAGYALRLPERFEVDTWLIQKCVRLFIPYLFYSALYWVFSGEYSVYSFLRFVLFNAWGGRIRNVYTVNWYITCLFLSYVFMYIIDKMIKSNFGKILILCIMACLGIAESYLLIPPGGGQIPGWLCFPWNVDVCLISTPLLALGYYGKKHINHIQEKIYTCVHIRPMSLLIGILTNLLILICFAWYLHPYYECFVMKYSRYRMFYFAILIQAFAFVLILFVSGFLEFFNPIRTFIQKIGRASFIIMYSHLIVKAALIKATDGDSSTFLFILISCMLGCFINHLAKGYKYLAIVCGCG